MLSVKNLSFSYRKQRGANDSHLLLKSINLDVTRGEFVVLIGANGAGKSTLIKMMCSVLKPDSGTIYLDGRDIQSMSRYERSRKIAYVPQAINDDQCRLSVYEVVAQGLDRALSRTQRSRWDAVLTTLEEVGLTRYATTPLHRLSGGERQRVWIARALITHSDYLILDEPISALDMKYQAHIMGFLRSLAHEGRAVLAIVHDINVAAGFADRIALVHQGHIVASGSACQVMTSEVLSDIYRTPIDIVQVNSRPIALTWPEDQEAR